MDVQDPFDTCSAPLRTALSQHHILKDILEHAYTAALSSDDGSDYCRDEAAHKALSTAGLVATPFRHIVFEMRWRDIPFATFIDLITPGHRMPPILRHVRTIYFDKPPSSSYAWDMFRDYSFLPSKSGLEMIRCLCPGIRRFLGEDLVGSGIRGSWRVDFTSVPPSFSLHAVVQPDTFRGPLPLAASWPGYRCAISLELRIDDRWAPTHFASDWLSSDQVLDPSIAQLSILDSETDIWQITCALDRRNDAHRPPIERLEIHRYPLVTTPMLSALFFSAGGLTHLELGRCAGHNQDAMLPIQQLRPILNLAARDLPNLEKLYLTFIGERVEGREFNPHDFSVDGLVKKDWLQEVGLTIIMCEEALPGDDLSVALVKILATSMKYDPTRPSIQDMCRRSYPPMGIVAEKFVDEPLPIDSLGLWCERDFEPLVNLPPAKKHNLIAADWTAFRLAPWSSPKVDIEDLQFDDDDQPIMPVIAVADTEAVEPSL